MFFANGFDENSKVSRLKQWEQVYKSTGMMPDALRDKPELDSRLIYLWDLYIDIKKGCDKIGYAELDAYQRVKGVNVSSFEADLMIDLELLRIKSG